MATLGPTFTQIQATGRMTEPADSVKDSQAKVVGIRGSIPENFKHIDKVGAYLSLPVALAIITIFVLDNAYGGE
jgi:hypothetical protein